MNGYLIAEEGLLAPMTLSFEEAHEGKEWVLGRDPSEADIILEDPMVPSRQAILSYSAEGFLFENLSFVSPATQNGKVITEPVLLKEGDILQIGGTFFRFSEKSPKVETPLEEELISPPQEFAELSFGPPAETRWLIKVISGPNAGAEFSMEKNSSYILGKDPNSCDIIFQDLSVSRQHAKLTVDEDENVFIEDLGSRNGLIVNGELISDKTALHSEDLVALGTTTLLIVDRMKARETIISPPMVSMPSTRIEGERPLVTKKALRTHWKDLVIPKKYLILSGTLAAFILIGFVSMISLFKSEPVIVKQVDETEELREIFDRYKAVQFSFSPSSGKLFLVGHVQTAVEKQELLYLLKDHPFIKDIEDNVIVDEFVWQNMNDLLTAQNAWASVSIYSSSPGKFILRGYVKTLEEAQALSDYVNLNFPYLDRLENQIVVENALTTELQNLLADQQFAGITLQFSNGEVVLTGRAEEAQSHKLYALVEKFQSLSGVRSVKSFVVFTKEDTTRIDLSNTYQVSGYSQGNERQFFVVINGKILGQGDLLDGMKITKVQSNLVLLEKDGLKYRIQYNLQ